jgi:S1-C subfamily serine protease
LTESIPEKGKLEIIQFDDSRQVQRGEATVLQIRIARLGGSPYQGLVYELLTDLTVTGRGAPVLLDGRLAGLVASQDHSESVVSVIPQRSLSRFLSDAMSPPYQGVASAGFIWRKLVDPTKRAWLKVQDLQNGILVLATVPGTGAAATLRPNDVILSWDGREIDSLGFYEDASLGRMALPYLIKGHRFPGETVPLEIARDGKRLSIEIALAARSDDTVLIPENSTRERPKYLVEGGLVMREVTGTYLRSHGSNWERKVNPRIVHLYLTRRLSPSRPGERVVVLSSVLPDPINAGYEEFNNSIITRVNGVAVSNMADVFRVARRDGHISRIALRSYGVDLVLDGKRLPEANRRIAHQYRISELRYEGMAD